jgi:UDP-N-acetylmuramyl pentapeptide phosphotransferase/UDP-N-acetylglucosamine-1-phosphate transferase
VEGLLLPAAFGSAIVLVPGLLVHLRAGGFVRPNWRGEQLPFPAGIAIAIAALIALLVMTPVAELADEELFAPGTGMVLTYGFGVMLLGLIDDVFAGPSRGWRGHLAAVRARELSTGGVKAVGTLALALYVLSGRGYGAGEYLLAVALLTLTTNLFNLLDLRPGRCGKAFVLLGVGLIVAGEGGPFDALGVLVAPALVVSWFDLRERAMLGDTGANLIGGLAGLWLVLALGTTGQAVALVVVLALTVYGEFRSLSALIEKTPLVRQLDSIGRNGPHA